MCVIISLIMLISASACGSDSEKENTETGTTGTTSDTATDTQSAKDSDTEKGESETDKENTSKDLRVIISSDVHHTNIRTWYGVMSIVRMQQWVNAIKAEHEKKPIDLLIIAGDTSLDHLANEGTYTTSKVSTTKTFMENYVAQLPEEIPVFVLPGNHEQFSNEQWRELVGNDRYGTVELENNLFIMLDNYNSNLEPNRKGDPEYTLSDMDYINAQMAAHPDCENVWLVAHHFDYANESAEFKSLVKNDKRIKGLFSGHTHKCNVIDMGFDLGNKKLAQTGNFSYSYYTAYPTNDEDVKNSFWGFRELLITSTSGISNYIIAESKGVNIGGVKVDIPRSKVHAVKFY